jgi:hypothetical protein
VTHHAGIVKHHAQVLELLGAGAWRVAATEGYVLAAELEEIDEVGSGVVGPCPAGAKVSDVLTRR